MNDDIEKSYTLDQLGPDQCRWPLDHGKHYCGCKIVKGSPYCAGHKERSISNWQPKNKLVPGRLPSERS